MHKNDKIFLKLRIKSEIYSFIFLGKQKRECKILVLVIIFHMHAKSLQSCPTLRHSGLWLARLLCPCDSPDKNIGVGCHALLQGIFLTQ